MDAVNVLPLACVIIAGCLTVIVFLMGVVMSGFKDRLKNVETIKAPVETVDLRFKHIQHELAAIKNQVDTLVENGTERDRKLDHISNIVDRRREHR